MKELSIEEKAKRYDETLDRARKLHETCDSQAVVGWCEYIFPELQESEEERVRKSIYNYINVTLDDNESEEKEKWLTWLEKQGDKSVHIDIESMVSSYEQRLKSQGDIENSPLVNMCLTAFRRGVENTLDELYLKQIFANSTKTCKDEQKPTDKVEPKFKIGDWVIWDNKIICYIDNIYQGKESLMYTITDTNNMIRSYSVKSFDNNARLWTLQDAMDGDVLREDSCTFIIKRMKPNGTAIVYCCLFDDGDFDLSSTLGFDVDSTYPATKERRALLFQKMKEAGYEWDGEKKELKKIDIHELIEQKPAWGEEDELVIKDIEEAITNYWHGQSQEDLLDRLKSLKQRIKGE